MTRMSNDIILSLYQRPEMVFSAVQIGMLFPELTPSEIRQRMFRYVQAGKILNPRKGFYAKPNFTTEELACLVYKPAYLSLEYVLQRAGVIFQYDSAITLVSYRTRALEINDSQVVYRQIKGEILSCTKGIINRGNLNIATPERALLDMLYLFPNYYFDHVDKLNQQLIEELLDLYSCARLTERVHKIFANGYK